MPMPGWWRYLNKRFFNPRSLAREHTWSLITHTGRKSGATFVTPVEAFPVPGGFVIYLMYGRNTDWARNVLASQSGSVEKAGTYYRIDSAQIVPFDDVQAEMPKPVYRPPALLRVKELVRLTTSEERRDLIH